MKFIEKDKEGEKERETRKRVYSLNFLRSHYSRRRKNWAMTLTNAHESAALPTELFNHFKLQKFSRTAQEKKKRLRSILEPALIVSDGGQRS